MDKRIFYKSAFVAVMLIMASVLCAEASAKSDNTLNRARALMKEQTLGKIDSLRSTVKSLDADSLANTVVMETGEASENDAAGDEITGDMDSDNLIDVVTSSWDWVPIMGIVFGTMVPFGAFVLVVYFIIHSMTVKKRMKYDTITRCAESNHPLPPDFYKSEMPAPKNRLQSGIVWIGWGVAFVCLSIAGIGTGWWAIGMVPLFVGLSRVAVYVVEYRKANRTGEQADNAE